MIELLSIGCSGQELVDKLNEIIAVVNGMSNVSSYNDLSDKPTINGVTLVGEKTTETLRFAIADAVDYSTTITDTLATKTEVESAQIAATQAATSAVQIQIAGKLDKNPSSTPEATLTDGAAFVYVYGDGGVKKIKLDTLSKNVALALDQKSSLERLIQSSGKIIGVKGTQDGSNTDFSIDEGYQLGTSFLYFNGQLLTRGTDYIEQTSSSIVMLTHIPISSDVLRFVAVPLTSN